MTHIIGDTDKRAGAIHIMNIESRSSSIQLIWKSFKLSSIGKGAMEVGQVLIAFLETT